MTATSNGMERRLTVLSDLKDLDALLRDASVDEARVSQTSAGCELVIDVTRAMPERQTTVRRGLLKRVKIPWTKSQLTLRHVRTATAKRLIDLPSSDVPLLSAQAVAGGYEITIQAPDGLQVVAVVDRIEGTFVDVGEPIESP